MGSIIVVVAVIAAILILARARRGSGGVPVGQPNEKWDEADKKGARKAFGWLLAFIGFILGGSLMRSCK